MNWMGNLGLRWKILAGFGAVLAMTAVIGMVALRELDAAAERTELLYVVDAGGIEFTMGASDRLNGAAMAEVLAATTTDAAQRAKLLGEAREWIAAAEGYMAEYESTIVAPEDRANYNALRPVLDAVLADHAANIQSIESGTVDAALASGNISEALAGTKKLAADTSTLAPHFEKLITYNLEGARARNDSSQAAASATRRLILAVSAGAVFLGFGIAWFIARSVAGRLRRMVTTTDHVGAQMEALSHGMTAFAEGDLTAEVPVLVTATEVRGGDEVGQASKALDRAIGAIVTTVEKYDLAREGLRDMVVGLQESARGLLDDAAQLGESSGQMAAATGQIAAAISDVTRSAVTLADLSQGSVKAIEEVTLGTGQVAAAAETNASAAAGSRDEAGAIGGRIEALLGTSREMAESAEVSHQAARQGQESVLAASSSMEVISAAVARASESVNRLGGYGQQIGEIVRTIDEIASQTNLLALNAAIEAARAGEQGRGFAVVAENVRSLAERSSGATREIAGLIAMVQDGTREAVEAMAQGVNDVSAGRAIADEAGRTLGAIIEAVSVAAERTAAITGEIQGLAAGAERIVTMAGTIAISAERSAGDAKQMADATARVSDAVFQVSSTSEETSASAEEVSASTEELSAQSQELAATADHLRGLATELGRAAARFRIA